MKFVLWSWQHILFILSPLLILLPLYFIMRKRSEKTKYIVGAIIGVLSLGVLLMRNIDIYLSNGFDPEIIPLQVCHFGNIMVFIALIFKSKIAACIAFCLNLPAAFSSLVVADSLANYGTIFCIRAQAYIWGHLLIVIGAIYPIMLKEIRFDRKSFLYSIGVIILLLIPAIILNSYFNDVMHRGINYFYIYNSNGVPFDFMYIGEPAKYGWFTINWIYTFGVIGLGLVVIYLFFNIQRLRYIKDKNFETHNIFYGLKKKKITK